MLFMFQIDTNARSALCVPITNRDNHTIGIVMLTHKLNGLPFNHSDQDLFEVSMQTSMFV